MSLYSFFMKTFFIQMPSISIQHEEMKEYDRITEQASKNKGIIDYDCMYPKFRFIAYMCEQKKLIAHGTNHPSIEQFEIRKQTLFNGKYVEAVFGTKDAIWPVFYAVFNRSKLHGNFRNGCFRIANEGESYYFFSLTKQTMEAEPWTDGYIYFLSDRTFVRDRHSGIYFDEWISREPVYPSYRLAVTSQDFPLLKKVSIHSSNESIFKSWFCYKRRLK